MCHKCNKNSDENAHEQILSALDDIQEHLEELETLIEVYGCKCSTGKMGCKACEESQTGCSCEECASGCNCDL